MKTLKLCLILCLVSLTNLAQNIEQIDNISSWYKSQNWLLGNNLSPDPSIDAITFAKHYKDHTERWNKVFLFLRDNDLINLPKGKQRIDDKVTVSVEEYLTRAPGKEWLEGHKKNIDVQVIVSGRELQGTTKIINATDTVNTYKEEWDVANFLVPCINYHVIRPNQFTIFFPDDIHITNIQYGDKEEVKKIVFKVAVE